MPKPLRFWLESVAASNTGGGCDVVMFGVKAFAGKFFIEFQLRMLVNLDHDYVGEAAVVFAPIGAVRDAAFYQWFSHCVHLHPQVSRSDRAISEDVSPNKAIKNKRTRRKAFKEAYSKMSSSPTIAEAFLGKAFTRFRLLRSKTDKRFNVKKCSAVRSQLQAFGQASFQPLMSL
jgi:hypothetical protein